MKIKGSGLISTVGFVEKEYGAAAKEDWLNSLQEEVQHSIRYALASSWYPVEQEKWGTAK